MHDLHVGGVGEEVDGGRVDALVAGSPSSAASRPKRGRVAAHQHETSGPGGGDGTTTARRRARPGPGRRPPRRPRWAASDLRQPPGRPAHRGRAGCAGRRPPPHGSTRRRHGHPVAEHAENRPTPPYRSTRRPLPHAPVTGLADRGDQRLGAVGAGLEERLGRDPERPPGDPSGSTTPPPPGARPPRRPARRRAADDAVGTRGRRRTSRSPVRRRPERDLVAPRSRRRRSAPRPRGGRPGSGRRRRGRGCAGAGTPPRPSTDQAPHRGAEALRRQRRAGDHRAGSSDRSGAGDSSAIRILRRRWASGLHVLPAAAPAARGHVRARRLDPVGARRRHLGRPSPGRSVGRSSVIATVDPVAGEGARGRTPPGRRGRGRSRRHRRRRRRPRPRGLHPDHGMRPTPSERDVGRHLPRTPSLPPCEDVADAGT